MSLSKCISNILRKHGRPESDLNYYTHAIKGHTLDSIKIVLLGQDPYKDATKRTGLAFSYPPGVLAGNSVKDVIIAAIKGTMEHTDIDVEMIRNGDLTSWSEQGVFLLNVSPKVESEITKDELNTWHAITRELLTAIRLDNPVAIGILLGKKAEKFNGILPHNLLWDHPSRLSTINNDPSNPRHWNHCHCFWRANEILIENKIFPIIWSSVLYSPSIATHPSLVTYGSHDKLWLFTDGGATKLGGARARWAFIIKDSYGLTVMSMVREYTDNPTNNTAELKAILFGLKWIHACPEIYKSVEIVSDSEYSIKSITEWYPQWVTKGILATKSNTDLIGKIVKTVESLPLNIKWTHTRGHQKAPKSDSLIDEYIWQGNNEVDELCGY